MALELLFRLNKQRENWEKLLNNLPSKRRKLKGMFWQQGDLHLTRSAWALKRTTIAKTRNLKGQTSLCSLSVLSSTMLQSVTKYSSYLTHGWGITSKPKKPIYKYRNRLSAGQHHLKRISKKGEHVRIRSATDAGRLREREPLLTLRKYCHEIIADSFYQSTGITNYDEMLTMPHNEPTLLSPIHVVLKRRRDLMDTPVHQGFDDSEEAAIALCQTACTRTCF